MDLAELEIFRKSNGNEGLNSHDPRAIDRVTDNGVLLEYMDIEATLR
jgi:hypothetical protein